MFYDSGYTHPKPGECKCAIFKKNNPDFKKKDCSDKKKKNRYSLGLHPDKSDKTCKLICTPLFQDFNKICDESSMGGKRKTKKTKRKSKRKTKKH